MPSKKKKKKQDFQKVKLKVGRKLPRPTNETRTQFKVRGINIKSQFHLEHSAALDSAQPSATSVKVCCAFHVLQHYAARYYNFVTFVRLLLMHVASDSFITLCHYVAHFLEN